jgi:AcrR family transcriptional regulator
MSDTRQQILDAALRLFSERGYFSTSVHDIKRAAGLSTGAIYHHFGSKEAIAQALHEMLVARMATLTEEACAAGTTARERSRALLAALFALTSAEPTLVRFVLHARHQEFLPTAPPICSTRPFRLMLDLVAEGIRGGEIRPLDPLVAAAALFGGGLRLIHLHLDGVLPAPLADYLDSCWECGWRGVAV